MEASQEKPLSSLFTRGMDALRQAESCGHDICQAKIFDRGLYEKEPLSDIQKKFLDFSEYNLQHADNQRDLL